MKEYSAKLDGANPKDLIGARKAPLALVPPALVIATSEAMAVGAKKYGPYNWRSKPVKMSIYIEAALRHLSAFFDGENFAEDSGVSHVSHAAACLAIMLDGMALGNIIDDRPTPGPASYLLGILDKSGPVKNTPPRPGEEVERGQTAPWDPSLLRHMTATEAAEHERAELRAQAPHDYPCPVCDTTGHDPVLPHDVISERADRRFMPDERVGEDYD